MQAKGFSHSTRLQLLVQILLNEPQIFSTQGAALVELVTQASWICM